jgi:hypothetical protein
MSILGENKKISDLFSVVQDIDNNETITSSYVDKLMTTGDITKLDIKWPSILHSFYSNNLMFNSHTKDLLNKKISAILIETNNNITQIDNLHRFLHLNALFELLNELNLSYNQSLNCNNYTLKMCQTFYLEQILLPENKKLIEHWFDGIYSLNLDLFDGKHKSKYHKSIEILKNYLDVIKNSECCFDFRNSLINNFITSYSNWVAGKMILAHNSGEQKLSFIFSKLYGLHKINEIFISDINLRSNFLSSVILSLVICWKKYLDDVFQNNSLIDENIINSFNSVDLSKTNFHTYTIQFMELWQANIKQNITPKNYGNHKLFESLRKITPLIDLRNGQNKSDLVIKYIKDLYEVDSNLLGYILTGLNVLIKNVYAKNDLELNADIKHTLALISLHDNKEEVWNKYYEYTYKRIITMTKNYRINKYMINFEFDIFNQLIANGCVAHSDKTKLLLNNFKSSIDHLDIIHKLQINYKKEDGSSYDDFNGPDISKVDYTTFDKNLFDFDKIKYNLIEQTKYPKDIITYVSIGKSYFDLVSETNKIDWEIETSIINYNIGKLNLVSNVVQYTIINTINDNNKTNNNLNKDKLIELLVTKDQNNISDAKKYIESYLSYLISKEIVVLSHGNLNINTAFCDENMNNTYLDISNFTPSLTDSIVIVNNQNIETASETTTDTPSELSDKNEIQMTPECLSYLRLMMLIKMFKQNSTSVYPLNTITERLSEQINTYIVGAKLNTSLQTVFKNLLNVTDNQLLMELKSLEKRDIIEETKKNNSQGYIYVV